MNALLLMFSALVGAEQTDIPMYEPGSVEVPYSATGTLIRKHGCIYLRTTKDRFTIIWPSRTIITGAGDETLVATPDGQSRAIGAKVRLIGGETGEAAFAGRPVTLQRMKACGPKFFLAYRFGEP